MCHNGKLISITGIDGCGKSTQVALLENYLVNCGYKTKTIKLTVSDLICYNEFQNLKTDLLNKNIQLPIYEKGLILAFETYLKIKNIIEPLIKEGFIIITDRYVETNDIYLTMKEVNTYWIGKILSVAIIPDYYFYIDIPPEIAINRIKKRNEPIKQHENLKTLRELREMFLSKKSVYRYQVIDGDASKNHVLANIIDRIDFLQFKVIC